jgi:hypothetical protein
MFISPIDERIRAVLGKDDYATHFDKDAEYIYHDLFESMTELHCWCTDVDCSTCPVEPYCADNQPSFLDTYFPTLKQDHPELFI